MNLALHMRISALQPTDDEVNSRKNAAMALCAAWGKAKTFDVVVARAEAVAASLTLDAPPADIATEVEAAIQAHASAFLASDRPFDVGICSAAAALSMFESKPSVDGFSVVDILATALWSALAFQPQLQDSKREALRAEVLAATRDRALEAAEFSRGRSPVDEFGAFTVTSGEEAKSAATFKKATGETIKALRRNAALDREELDFLWWALGARSRLLKKPLNAVKEPVRALVAGIEASQHLRRFPCDVHRDLVLSTLEGNPALNLAGLLDAVGDARETIAASYMDSVAVRDNPQVFPLLFALVTGEVKASGADIERTSEDWGARALLEAGIARLQSTGAALL